MTSSIVHRLYDLLLVLLAAAAAAAAAGDAAHSSLVADKLKPTPEAKFINTRTTTVPQQKLVAYVYTGGK